jgi:ketosteroid isomerase-like protein
MTRDDVQAWLDRYVAAWRSYDPAAIGDLFSADATYAYHPYDPAGEILRGREAIVADWLANRDDPASWEATYEPYAVDGDRAVAIGRSSYVASADAPARTYWNNWLLRFDDEGRCREYIEYFMTEPRR